MTTFCLAEAAVIQFGWPFESRLFGGPGEGTPLVKGATVGVGELKLEGGETWPAELPVSAEYYLAAGDVVIAMDGTLLQDGVKAALIRQEDVPSLLVQRVARLRARPEFDAQYLWGVIRSNHFADYVRSITTGSVVPHISGPDISRFEWDFPDIHQQRAIGEVLGALDDKIAANRRLVDRCEEYATTLAVSPDVTVSIGELATHFRNSADPLRYGEATVDSYSLPGFDSGMAERVPASELKSSKNALHAPTVLISKLNPRTPRVWLAYPDQEIPALASPEFVALEPNGISVSALWAAARHPEFTSAVAERAGGTTGSHQRVRPEDILVTEVRDVRQLDAAAIAEIESVSTRAIFARRESAALARTRDELLPLLLSGKLTVKDAEKTVEELV